MSRATPESCVGLLREMIRFDTVTPHVSGRRDAERPLARHLAVVAERWGMAPRWLPVEDAADNLLLTRTTDADLPWLMLDSHLDTVGVSGMTIQPFAGEVRAGRVWGRGASDTKGTGAAMLWAAAMAVREDAAGCNLAVLLSVGEEHAQAGARSFVQRDLPSLGWTPAAVIVGEPTGLQAIVAGNGFLRCRITTHGLAAHSSTPERGRNAISDMARLIVAIEQQHTERLTGAHPLTGRGTCSINGVEGGAQHNIIPDACTIQIDQRLTPGESAAGALGSIRAAADAAAIDRPGLRYDIHTVETAPGYAAEGSRQLGERVAGQLTGVGLRSSIAGAPYTTNANHYAAAGLPSIVLGPGDIAQAHTTDEWIAIDELERGVRAYAELIRNPPLDPAPQARTAPHA